MKVHSRVYIKTEVIEALLVEYLKRSGLCPNATRAVISTHGPAEYELFWDEDRGKK